MKKWKTIERSRYKINYDEELKVVSFYLSGANYDDEINNVSRQIQYEIIQRLLLDEEKIDLSIVELNDRIHILGKVEGINGSTDLGLIPSDDGLDKNILEKYVEFPANKRNNLLKVISVDNPWNNDLLLLRVSFNTVYMPQMRPKSINLPEPIIFNDDLIGGIDMASKPDTTAEVTINTPVSIVNQEYDIPLNNQIKMESGLYLRTWEDVNSYMLSHIASLLTVQHIFNLEMINDDNLSTSQS